MYDKMNKYTYSIIHLFTQRNQSMKIKRVFVCIYSEVRTLAEKTYVRTIGICPPVYNFVSCIRFWRLCKNVIRIFCIFFQFPNDTSDFGTAEVYGKYALSARCLFFVYIYTHRKRQRAWEAMLAATLRRLSFRYSTCGWVPAANYFRENLAEKSDRNAESSFS